jgi:uncharacterized protein
MRDVATETVPELAAAGSLPRAPAIAHPPVPRRIRLLIELALVFAGAPLGMAYAIQKLHVPLFVVLQPVLAIFIVYLLWDPTFRVRRELSRGFPWSELVAILAVFLVVGGATAALVQQQLPADFLSFPKYRIRLWTMIMVFYPLLSVVPQELVYRTFFFHRYGPLFGNHRWLAVAANGLLFGFAHIIFGNLLSMVLSTGLGLLLAYRYTETRSFWAVWLEHTLYGQLVFTVGLGRYFFTGVSVLT